MHDIDLSVCIVNWNSRNYLTACLESIEEKTTGINYEIIILDNASTDGSQIYLKKYCSKNILIFSHTNLGFSKGNNIASKYARGRYLLFLNPDTELVTNAFYGMVRFLDRNQEFGAIGCMVKNEDGSIQYTCARDYPTPFNQFSYLSMLYRLFPRNKMFSTVELNFWDHKDSREINCLSGACMMIRRDLNNVLCGFDESIFMYGEDVDLCYRIKRKGYKLYYLASEEIIHYGGKSSSQLKLSHYSFISQRCSSYYFIKKSFGLSQANMFRVAVAFGCVIRIFVVGIISIMKMIIGDKTYMDQVSKYINLFRWSMCPGRPKVD